jgi:DNA (cytosine-5)-methyltransferase 1
MTKYSVVDLFAGVGGLSYAFSHDDAFDLVMANEIDREISHAYELNHPGVKMLCCDIKKLTEEEIKKHIKVPVDIVVGSPPCQSFSTLGKRKNDEKAQLFNDFCRVLRILEPKIFIFENVTGILSMQKGTLFKTILDEFSKIGYELKYKILNAAEYGVPQIRERVILVGTRGKNNFEFPPPTHGAGLKPFVTLADAIGNMPAGLCDNTPPKNADYLKKIMLALPDGGTKFDLPPELRPKSGYGNTYAKLWWNKPSTTITRNFGCVSSSRCIHPRESRALSTREGARLQSFPDDYVFFGSRSKKNLEIGNAVPPLLSVALARQVKKFFLDFSRHL